MAKKRDTERSPIPRWAIGTLMSLRLARDEVAKTIAVLLVFVVCGGALFELIRLFFPSKTPVE